MPESPSEALTDNRSRISMFPTPAAAGASEGAVASATGNGDWRKARKLSAPLSEKPGIRAGPVRKYTSPRNTRMVRAVSQPRQFTK
jgi:hypothetical protein